MSRELSGKQIFRCSETEVLLITQQSLLTNLEAARKAISFTTFFRPLQNALPFPFTCINHKTKP